MGRARGHYVEGRWVGSPTGQTAAQRRGGTYMAFVPDPIADLQPTLPADVAQRLEAAALEIKDLNDAPPRLTALEALARQLLRAESLASSRIEGLNMGHRRIALEDFRSTSDEEPAGHPDSRAADMVGNIRAMERAIEIGASAKRLDCDDVLEIHETLLRFGEDAHIAGKLREAQGWIGGSNPSSAEYIPPPRSEIPRLVDDLCEFLNRDDIPPLAQAALGHAQFETIHPFADGNGRVGRCLIHAVLRRRGLTPRYVPPLSVLLAAKRKEYFAGLTGYRDEEGLNDWIYFFAATAADAAYEARRLARLLDELEEGWLDKFERPPRSDSALRRVMEMLPAHPVLNTRLVQTELDVSDVAAGNALNQLQRVGILTLVKQRVRGRVWECLDLFKLINQFETEITG